MKKLINLFFIAFIATSVSGCAVSSTLFVTNSVSLTPGTYDVVKPLNETFRSTHFLGAGGWKVRDAKQTVIKKWHGQLGPNQALADIHFTESYSHFIPWVFYQEHLSISAWIVEPKGNSDSDASIRPVASEYAAPGQEEQVKTISIQEDPLNLLIPVDIPYSLSEITLYDGTVINYREEEPIGGQILDGLEKVMNNYKKYVVKTNKLKTTTEANIKTFQEWYSISGLKSDKIESAIKKAKAMM